MRKEQASWFPDSTKQHAKHPSLIVFFRRKCPFLKLRSFLSFACVHQLAFLDSFVRIGTFDTPTGALQVDIAFVFLRIF